MSKTTDDNRGLMFVDKTIIQVVHTIVQQQQKLYYITTTANRQRKYFIRTLLWHMPLCFIHVPNILIQQRLSNKQTFSVAIMRPWNRVPPEIVLALSLMLFRKIIETYIYPTCFPRVIWYTMAIPILHITAYSKNSKMMMIIMMRFSMQLYFYLYFNSLRFTMFHVAALIFLL